MGWLRFAGSLKSQVSSAEYSRFYRALLQKRRMILRSMLIVATTYIHICVRGMPTGTIYIYIYIYIYMFFMYVYTHMYIHNVYTHIYSYIRERQRFLYTDICVRTYTCIHTCVYLYTYMCMYIYMWGCTCIYSTSRVCTYTCEVAVLEATFYVYINV